jgi:hypothetical protein
MSVFVTIPTASVVLLVAQATPRGAAPADIIQALPLEPRPNIELMNTPAADRGTPTELVGLSILLAALMVGAFLLAAVRGGRPLAD